MTMGEGQGREGSACGTSLAARIVRVLPYVGVIVAIVIFASPSITDLLEAWRAGSHISTLSSAVDALPTGEKQRLLDQAHRYNARLAGDASASAGEELLPYEEQLVVDSTTSMGWLDIPSIEVRLPVYHGTTVEGLSAGVGHLCANEFAGGRCVHALRANGAFWRGCLAHV